MKKLISLLLLLAMVFSLCACGEDGQISEEEVAEVVEEVMPTVEELAAKAAELYYSGNYSEVFSALADLEDSGVDFVTELLGICHYYGYGTDIDTEKAVEILNTVADKGSAAAKLIIAEATRSGDGARQDPELAEKLYAEFVELAESLGADEELAGSVYAALADCYAHGFGTELDMDKALAAAEKAIASADLSVFDKAELGELIRSHAQDTLDNIEAELNESGYGIIDLSDPAKTQYMTEPQKFIDRVKAAEAELEKGNELYRQAKEGVMMLAESGNVIALKLMGDYYFGALGGEAQDYEKAMDYYMQAADFDYAPAQAQIALMYQEGYGVEVSYEQAMEWNNRAAQQGNAQGQAQIGYLYHMGLGVTQNLDEAGRWYSRAADQGDTWAAAKLAQTEITNPQLAFEFHA